MDGRRWRRQDPALPPEVAERLLSHLGQGRSGVRALKKAGEDPARRAKRLSGRAAGEHTWQAAGMGTDPHEQPRVLLGPKVRRWEWVILTLALAGLAAASWLTLTRGHGSIVSLLPAAVPLAFLLTMLRPKRVELRDTELVLRHAVRTRRIPYADIAAVRGDIPSRVDWSTRLELELRDGRTVGVPSTREPLAHVHDLIAERIGQQPAG